MPGFLIQQGYSCVTSGGAFYFVESEFTSEQTFVGLQYVLKTSSTRFQRNNFSSSKTSCRRLEQVLEIRLEDVLKIS